jgi:hypothetical protein
LTALLELSEEIRSQHLASLVGSECTVLVEGTSKSGAYTGRTERNEIVHFGCKDNPTGEFLTLRIERALRHSLVGHVLDEQRAVDFEAAREQAAASNCGSDGAGHQHAGHQHAGHQHAGHHGHAGHHAAEKVQQLPLSQPATGGRVSLPVLG